MRTNAPAMPATVRAGPAKQRVTRLAPPSQAPERRCHGQRAGAAVPRGRSPRQPVRPPLRGPRPRRAADARPRASRVAPARQVRRRARSRPDATTHRAASNRRPQPVARGNPSGCRSSSTAADRGPSRHSPRRSLPGRRRGRGGPSPRRRRPARHPIETAPSTTPSPSVRSERISHRSAALPREATTGQPYRNGRDDWSPGTTSPLRHGHRRVAARVVERPTVS